MGISVKPLELNQAHFVVDYFRNGPPEFNRAMGADHSLFPPREEWIQFIQNETSKPYEVKEYFYVIWYFDDKPVGHCNINFIHFGIRANMHLHLWEEPRRRKGLGAEFVKASLPYYFELFDLQTLICEPNAYNKAPNATLRKLGFEFIKKHKIDPGPINYVQEVNRYELSRERFQELYL